jgi:hypothetical protein
VVESSDCVLHCSELGLAAWWAEEHTWASLFTGVGWVKITPGVLGSSTIGTYPDPMG